MHSEWLGKLERASRVASRAESSFLAESEGVWGIFFPFVCTMLSCVEREKGTGGERIL